MRPLLERLNVSTAVDIGANVGWFSFQLADFGATVVAIERVPKFYRPLLHTASTLEKQRVALLTLELTPDTAALLPHVDAVLFLAVWHHVVRERGLDAARGLLESVWNAAGKVLFFETGEEEAVLDYGLPELHPTPRVWIEGLLHESCSGGEVVFLGQHKAHAPDGLPCWRNLFAVVRDGVG